jgi:DNA-binding transcriptional ArsR family regulator
VNANRIDPNSGGMTLTKRFVNATLLLMVSLRVIDDPASASVALDPVRSRLLSELRTPASAAALAGRMGLQRQKVNYHLRTLEVHGLVRVDSKKRWGGLTERRLVATATSYVVSPAALGPVAADPARGMDRLSASYLVALAARAVREVGQLLRKSEELNKRLATLSIDTEVRFRSAEDRAAFSSELTAAVAALVSRYHDESAPGGRRHRLMVGAYPAPAEVKGKETT